MPSTYSVSNCSDLDSSTVMTPSLPTLSITSAISWPISWSAAELVATEAISSLVSIFCAILRRAATTTSVACSMPRLISIGFEPAARLFRPSVTIACASTVEVVVPSPAMSLVLVAASFSSWAPMFSYGSSSSISLATVTPSWVMVGAPYFLSMATLRPLGPSVVPTALARISTPFFKRRRASSEKTICLAVIIRCSLFRELSALLQADRPVVLDDRQQVAFFQDQQLLAIVLELRAGVLGEQDRFAHGHIQRHAQSLIVARAWASGPDRALCGFSLAVSGSTRPLAVMSSCSSGSTTTRSPRGLRLIVMFLISYPTLPSIWSSTRQFNSTAYSIGSSFTNGSIKPRTTRLADCSAERPRLIR